jgi:uncharacterized membrane protein
MCAGNFIKFGINGISYFRSIKVSKVEELKLAIEALPEDEYAELRQWLSEKDWQNWDKQIEADSIAGNLNFLVKEAKDGKKSGKLRDL